MPVKRASALLPVSLLNSTAPSCVSWIALAFAMSLDKWVILMPILDKRPRLYSPARVGCLELESPGRYRSGLCFCIASLENGAGRKGLHIESSTRQAAH